MKHSIYFYVIEKSLFLPFQLYIIHNRFVIMMAVQNVFLQLHLNLLVGHE